MFNIIAATIGIALLFPGTVDARAAESSSWDGDERGAVRLIAASYERDSGLYRAGLEIRLGSGWKTYWRYPGDSGVPPRFDFAHSDNVKSATVLWPAPRLFSDVEGDTIGYKDNVILPLRIAPRDPAKPVTLRVRFDYAVCEKLCVPAQASAELTLAKAPGSADKQLTEAEARVPKPAKLGESGVLSVRGIKQEAAAPPRLLVDIAAPAQTKIDLFAEGPTSEWALPIPKPVAGAPAGLQRFSFTLDGKPAGANAKDAVLKLTVVAGDKAIEVPFHLD
ncbi:MAG: cytochrome C biogenesis protein [Rhizobiales bacterium]|nr:cytochrome C biogenesis protein [Hyphomicrobiales bacterium]